MQKTPNVRNVVKLNISTKIDPDSRQQELNLSQSRETCDRGLLTNHKVTEGAE